jgi:cytochrome oxidase Cu insertion factor (SCO1/SenC/PrrC family)
MNFRSMTSVLLAAGIALSSSIHAAEPKAADGAKRVGPVAVGDVAPEFTLTDQNGRSHSLATERGKRPVILVFYRGYW